MDPFNLQSLRYIPRLAGDPGPRRREVHVQKDGSQSWLAAGRFHRRLLRLALHELANPLAAARLLAELQRRGAGSAEDQLHLADQLGRAATLLGELRALAREGLPEPIATQSTIETVLALTASEASRVGARLIVGHTEDLRVRVPRYLLLQVLVLGVLAVLDQFGDQGGADQESLWVLSQQQEGDEVVFCLEGAASQPISKTDGALSPPRPAGSPADVEAFHAMVREMGGGVLVAPGDRVAHDPAWRFTLPGVAPGKS